MAGLSPVVAIKNVDKKELYKIREFLESRFFIFSTHDVTLFKLLSQDLVKCAYCIAGKRFQKHNTEAEFLDVIGTKVLRVAPLLFTITSNRIYPPGPPPPLEQKWFETGL
jgi:hypothetical protein